MLELMYINLIVELIDSKTDITKVPLNILKKMVKLRPNSSINRKTLDYKMKCIHDYLRKRYSYLQILVSIDTLRRQACTLRDNSSDHVFKFDIELFIKGCESLYEYLEPYYLTNILYKMSIYFQKLKDGSFDQVEFFKNIQKEENLSFPVDSDEEETQLSLEGFDLSCKEETSLEPLSDAVLCKNRSTIQLRDALRSEFTMEEISDYVVTLIDMLAVNLTPENMVISRSICHVGDILSKKPSQKKKKETLQVKMLTFQ